MPPEGRTVVADRGLTADAVKVLTPLVENVSFEQLAVVKGLLRTFFSDRPWTATDDTALAAAVGPPAAHRDADTQLRHLLAPDLMLVAGWVDGTFAVDVAFTASDHSLEADRPDLSTTFAYGVVPEPTPNPRTVRFATRATGVTESQTHGREDATGAIAAIFAVDDDIVDVLVGPDFVAVSLRRPVRWPIVLDATLRAVAAGFGGMDDGAAPRPPPSMAGPAGDHRSRGVGGQVRARQPTSVQRAWDELGSLRADDADDLIAIARAARDPDPARRQVAAYLVGNASPGIARATWAELASDASRSVRRAALDAMVDAEREELRPILEPLLRDADGWIRWKAANGLGALGVGPSRRVVEALRDDDDFRVRLEVARVLDTSRRD